MTDFGDHGERVLHLAGLMVECPCSCHLKVVFHKDSGCRDCGSTGKVPRFPMLRKPCICDHGKVWRNSDYGAIDEPHKDCQGRGWIPVLALEALMEEAETVGTIVLRNDCSDVRDWWLAYWTQEADRQFPLKWRQPGAADGLSLALCRAVEGEQLFTKEIR